MSSSSTKNGPGPFDRRAAPRATESTEKENQTPCVLSLFTYLAGSSVGGWSLSSGRHASRMKWPGQVSGDRQSRSLIVHFIAALSGSTRTDKITL